MSNSKGPEGLSPHLPSPFRSRISAEFPEGDYPQFKALGRLQRRQQGNPKIRKVKKVKHDATVKARPDGNFGAF